MKAHVIWKTKEAGGRNQPPAGVGSPPYATVVRFSDSSEPWPPPVAWSLVVEKIESESSEYEWLASVKFLVDEAPAGELRSNREFELFEGGRCVATGKLI